MFSGLHHFNLIVADKEKTKAFYNALLGLEIALETEIEDDEFSRGVGLPGTKVLATFSSCRPTAASLRRSNTCIRPARRFQAAPSRMTADGSTFASRSKI